MGSYANCYLGKFSIGSSKNDIDFGLMSLFRAADKRIVSAQELHSYRYLAEHYDVDPETDESFVFYVTLANIVKDRLDLMGYTLSTCSAVFNDCVKVELQRVEENLSKYRENDPHGMRAYYETAVRLFGELNALAWVENLRAIHDGDFAAPSKEPGHYPTTLIEYMLDTEWYGYPGPDRNVGLRLALEACSEEQELVYDLTDLVLSGYVDTDDDHVAQGLSFHQMEYAGNGRIVILTEGRSDSWVLSESLSLLYPHLADYFSFMDFEAFKVPGGSGSLANLTRAMGAAGIVNKIISLFDNDTAAKAAIRSMNTVALPPNIRVIQLPERDWLRAYPTLGPTGATSMDVNGIAGSIELYLGKDVLVDAAIGSCIPIQWTGYDAGVGAYQGEILRKKEIQDIFSTKLNACKANRTLIAATDWDDLRSVWNYIFQVFHEVDGEQIRQAVTQYV